MKQFVGSTEELIDLREKQGFVVLAMIYVRCPEPRSVLHTEILVDVSGIVRDQDKADFRTKVRNACLSAIGLKQ